MSRTLLSEQLKDQTKINHQLLEKQIILLIKAIRTTADYSRLLMLFYTFFGGIETLVDKTLNTDCIPDYLQRRKTAFLHNDLCAMNVEAQPFAKAVDLPEINNHLQASGALYVMEGSTLGGPHISKMIRDQINPAKANILTFFDGYKNETQHMWQAFKIAIDGMVLDKNEQAVVVHAANDTFARFSNWITMH